jgi:hypothetical protein
MNPNTTRGPRRGGDRTWRSTGDERRCRALRCSTSAHAAPKEPRKPRRDRLHVPEAASSRSLCAAPTTTRRCGRNPCGSIRSGFTKKRRCATRAGRHLPFGGGSHTWWCSTTAMWSGALDIVKALTGRPVARSPSGPATMRPAFGGSAGRPCEARRATTRRRAHPAGRPCTRRRRRPGP